jgi:hypothetical protein
MATSGIRQVLKFEKIKDSEKFREVFKECIAETRKGESAVKLIILHFPPVLHATNVFQSLAV